MTYHHTGTYRGRRRPLASLLKGAHPTVTRSVLAWRLWHGWSLRRARQTPYRRRGSRTRYQRIDAAIAAYFSEEGVRDAG